MADDDNGTEVGCPTPRPTSWAIDQVAISVSGSGGKRFHEGGGGAVVWLLALVYCFLGVAIVSDVFMAAIERITSDEKTVTRDVMVNGRTVKRTFHVRVWNATIANLTLMALGSSAPEILLSIIEIVGNDFYSGDLGPSTIVGSAAFNLMIILAVCVAAIPDGESRRINDFEVFQVTAVFSVFAYLWLLFILVVNTPDYCDVWEGVATFLFFPLLVSLAYAADRGAFGARTVLADDGGASAADVARQMAALERELYEKNAASPKEGRRGSVVDDGFLSKLQGGLGGPPQPKSKAYYRVAASKVYKRTAPKRASLLARDFHLPGFLEGANGVHAVEDAALKASATSSPAKVAPLADDDLEARERPEAKTRSLQALMEHRYDRKERRNARVEETLERLRRELPAAADARSGPGVLDFHRDDGDEDGYECWESDLSQALVVVRTQGCVGAVACKYATRDGSACAGGDYVAASGALEFADGEVAKRLDVEIVDDAEVEAHSETFFVDLTDATGGATFDATWDGGEDRAVATVVIIDDTDRRGLAGLLIPLINRDKLNLALNDYKSQFRDAVALEGDAPTPGDYAMHVLALPWKVCFACIPPPSYGGGWVCFFVALVYIGGLTLVIGEVATLLGSALGIADSVTAITFVALGTSLPDTFASKTAATADPYADAAVGNVTGSNSVNVFLGLGLPWAVAAIYWKYAPDARRDEWRARYGKPDCLGGYALGERKDGAWDHVGFLVPAGSLGVSVTTFSACACATLVVLVLRRKLLGAELGGPRAAKHATAALFVCLWLVYIVVSTSKAYGWI